MEQESLGLHQYSMPPTQSSTALLNTSESSEGSQQIQLTFFLSQAFITLSSYRSLSPQYVFNSSASQALYLPYEKLFSNDSLPILLLITFKLCPVPFPAVPEDRSSL
ncbi:hypothetical protein ACKKBF_B40040 [Auxenochlorella protothecoides x Auxenochlorella symbiontica]